MKLNQFILVNAIAISMTACISSEDDISIEGFGKMSLEVAVHEPLTTKAANQNISTAEFPISKAANPNISTEEFPVSIVGAVSKTFNNAAELKDKPVLLPIGAYVVTSHSPGELEQQMSAPYYKGQASANIQKGITENINVICKMANSPIEVKYDQEFLSTFSTWTLTITDGNENSLVYTNEDGVNLTPVYWLFGEDVEAIKVTIKATTRSTGSTISDYVELLKSSATESYDGDNKSFAGGDKIVLNLGKATVTEGTVTGIEISANVSFTMNDQTVNVDVLWDQDKDGNEEGEGSGEGGGTTTDGPQVILPSDISYSISGNPAAPATANATLKTPAGLQSAIVKITTDNKDFQATLAEAAFDTPGALLTGAELVGNKGMQDLFDSMDLTDESGNPKKTPVVGETEYIFPLHTFYIFLNLFTGVHHFEITLTDANGKTVKDTITMTITE
ncbi:MAG: DUF4493 domain-containing protein [Bacteroidales bacterium]|nr:DUF4493 domain-containing protein [Bacteroidales bacterium]